jgi:hypothetical protein
MRRSPEPPPKAGRPGITSLPSPNSRFNPTRSPGFETREAVAREDRLRAARLRWGATKLPRARARELNEVADAIDPDVTINPTTPASSRYMRLQRIRLIGALWELVYGR